MRLETVFSSRTFVFLLDILYISAAWLPVREKQQNRNIIPAATEGYRTTISQHAKQYPRPHTIKRSEEELLQYPSIVSDS